jgi:hypothetical protein
MLGKARKAVLDAGPIHRCKAGTCHEDMTNERIRAGKMYAAMLIDVTPIA